jgi:hypothetical protein
VSFGVRQKDNIMTADARHLTLVFVNAGISIHEVALDLAGRQPAGMAAAWTIQHDDSSAHNQPGEPPRIDIRELPPGDATGKSSSSP